MYSPEPSVEVSFIRLVPHQNSCHHARCGAWRVADEAVADEPNSVDAVAAGSPPVHLGAPTSTRKEPSVFGLKLTFTVRLSTVDATTLRPPPVTAASDP